jgi:hypothetical protein
MSWITVDMDKLNYSNENILGRLYEQTELKRGDLNEYLKLDHTEEYKNNNDRIERAKKEAELSPEEFKEYLRIERLETLKKEFHEYLKQHGIEFEDDIEFEEYLKQYGIEKTHYTIEE